MMKKIGIYASAVVIAILVLAPFLWLLRSSITVEKELSSVPPVWLPQKINFGAFLSLLTGDEKYYLSMNPYKGFPRSATLFPMVLRNSLIAALSVAAVTLTLGSLAAYSFARFKFRGKDKISILILVTRMIPAMSILVPVYLMFTAWGLQDTILALVLIYSATQIPYSIWLLKAYFETIPVDLEEAALIDGCSRIGAFVRIVLPLSTPALVAVGIFAFMWMWNGFVFALILGYNNALTIQPATAYFATSIDIEYGLMNAAGVISVIPPIMLALVFQKYIISGLMRGAIK